MMLKHSNVFLSSANQFVCTSDPSWSGSTANGVELEPGGQHLKRGSSFGFKPSNHVMKYDYIYIYNIFIICAKNLTLPNCGRP